MVSEHQEFGFADEDGKAEEECGSKKGSSGCRVVSTPNTRGAFAGQPGCRRVLHVVRFALPHTDDVCRMRSLRIKSGIMPKSS
jgi:hypothetical protein